MNIKWVYTDCILYSDINRTKLSELIIYIKKYITQTDLQFIVNSFSTIKNTFTGDGCGLSGGIICERIIIELFVMKIPSFTLNSYMESDFIINSIPYSFKKISGKSTIALDWSKNKNTSIRNYFVYDIIIINMKSQRWWKTAPKNHTSSGWNSIIPMGIYFVSSVWCKCNISISSNNKTNTLITSTNLYKMLIYSLRNNVYIELPSYTNQLEFRILNAFS